jgi:hypothetical protein
MRIPLWLHAAILLIAAFSSSCQEEGKVPTPTGCGAGQTQIRVGDGYLQSMCGCNEGDGTQAVGNDTLTCTASAPRTVIFHFANAKLTHRIQSTGSGALSFPSSPLYTALQEHPVLAHAITLETTGDYTFVDDFQPGIRGVIRLR